ncbi:ROK family protein [Ileibacterium valens]|uniref:ROK family protein n=1 Tax=Ileibacterium valens TaxID=1862668 RepID=UPI00259BED15|nr:ROK family protein [Ileibacterium valens]
MKYAIGVDIGGTNTRVALIDEDFNLAKRVQFATDPKDPEGTLQKVASTIASFGKEIEGIGVSAPGPLDLINGYILASPNLDEEWWTYPIPEKLKELTGANAYLENDANLAALAEAVVGEGKDKRFVQFLTVSTGLGSGQIKDREIYIGAHGFANEVANCIMWQDGPSHGRIIPGGIEALSSGTAITTRARNAGLDVAHAGEVNDLAEDGNEVAVQIMDEAKEYLANFIAMLYAVTDPEICILGGSVAMKINDFVEDVEKRVKAKVMDPVKPYVDIRRSTLNEDSGLLGAGYLAFSKAAAAEESEIIAETVVLDN